MKFRYRQYQVDPSPTIPDGILYRPLVPIRVIGVAGDASFRALLDTGSDETIFPRSIGDAIGVVMDETASVAVSGIGGQQVLAVLGDVEIEITQGKEAYRWPTKVRFVAFARPEDEVAILGHAGVLRYFDVTFLGGKREVRLKRNAELLPGQVG